MKGTIVDVVVVVITAVVGLFLRKKLRDEHKELVLAALGLAAIPIGVSLFLETQNPLVVLISIPAGFLWCVFGALMNGWNPLGIGSRSTRSFWRNWYQPVRGMTLRRHL